MMLLKRVKHWVRSMYFHMPFFYLPEMGWLFCQAIMARIIHGQQPVLPMMVTLLRVGGCELQYRLITLALKDKQMSSTGISFFLMPKYHSAGTKPYFFLVECLLRILKPRVLLLFKPDLTSIIPFAKKMNMKIIYVEVGMPDREHDHWDALKTQMDGVDYVLSVSEEGLQRLKQQFNYHARATVIGSIIQPLPTRPHLKISKHFTIICVARMVSGKGIDDLVDAFKRVFKEQPRARLILVGEGPYHQFIEKKIAALGLTEVIECSGRVSRDALANALQQADVFCLPSLSEGRPCSIIEAMSFALPVVATNVGGIPELVKEGETGLLVPPHNPIALSEALLSLANHPERCVQLGQAGLNTYLEHHGPKVLIHQYVTCVKEIINECT